MTTSPSIFSNGQLGRYILLSLIVLPFLLLALVSIIARAAWTPVVVDDGDGGNVGRYSSLAALSNGNPAISYLGDSELKYARATDITGANWVSMTVDTGGGGSFTSLAILSNGNPAISYRDNANNNLKYAWSTDITGTNWVSMTVDNNIDTGLYTSLAVVNGNPAISYYDQTGGDLKYAYATNITGTNWVIVTVDDAGGTNQVGRFTSLAVVNGKPAISYHDITNENLKYTWSTNITGTNWVSVIVDTGGINDVGWYPSLEVVNGNPAIAYRDATNGDVKYARATNITGTNWVSMTVTNGGNVNINATPLVVIDGNPAISYYDATTGDVMYVRANDVNGTIWNDPPLAADSNIGFIGSGSPSLAVVNGRPAVSYYDDDIDPPFSFGGSLKYAQLGNDPPTTTNDVYSMDWNTTLTVTNPISGVLGNDSDINGDQLSAVLDQDVFTGTLNLNGDGTFEYTPPLVFVGVVSFTYYATDGSDNSSSTIATINISCFINNNVEFSVCVDTAIDGNDVSLDWLHNADEATGYRVWMSSTPYFTPTEGISLTTAFDLDGFVNERHSGAIGDSVAYYYYVEALNCSGCPTPYSNHVGKFDYLIEPGN